MNNKVAKGMIVPVLLIMILLTLIFIGYRVGDNKPTITGNSIYEENIASENGITRGVICNAPYIAIEGGCCRDSDSNDICDAAQSEDINDTVLTHQEKDNDLQGEEEVSSDDELGFSVHSAYFNSEAKELEVVYTNDGDEGVYFQGEVNVDVDSESETLSDIEPRFIGRGDFRTVIYSVSGNVEDGSDVFVDNDFGYSDDNLRFNLRDDIEIEVYETSDKCDLDIMNLSYDTSKDSFVALVKNFGDVDCYVDGELRDVYVDEDFVTLSADSTRLVRVDDEREIFFDQKMYQEELDENSKIYTYIFFSEQKDKLHLEARRNLEYDVL